MLIKTRQEMAQLLNDRMNSTYQTLSDEQELEPETSLVKTYLVEAHLAEDAPSQAVRGILESSFVPDGKNQGQTSTID